MGMVSTRISFSGIVAIVLMAIGVAGCSDPASSKVKADLTIYVAGDLLKHGGTVFISPIPVSQERWQAIAEADNRALPVPDDLSAIAEDGKRMTVVLDRQFGDIQFLYPENTSYNYRFRPHPDEDYPDGDHLMSPENPFTRVLSVGGTDGSGRGPEMTSGFSGLSTSGNRIIQVIAPDTDEDAARVLASIRYYGVNRPLDCIMATATSVCTYSAAAWAVVEPKWRKGIAEKAREDRRFKALDDCHKMAESSGETGGTCELVSRAEEEPVYRYRK